MNRVGRLLRLSPWVAAGTALILTCFSVLSDYDFWWHLALGRQVAGAVATGSWSLPDAFSYTAPGAPQLNLEWFGDLLIYGAWRACGFVGVDLLMTLLLGATCTFVALAVTETLDAEERTSRWTVLGVTLGIFLVCIRFRVFPRPALFTYVFLAAFVWLLSAHRARGGWVWLAPLVPLAALWSNTSKGAVYALACVAAFAIGSLVERKPDRRLWLALPAVAAGLMANPDGFRSISIVYEYRQALTSPTRLGEFQPLSAMMLWGRGAYHTAGFQVALALTALGLVIGRWRRQPGMFLLAVALAVQAFLAIRMVDLFAVVAAVPVGLSVAAGVRRWGATAVAVAGGATSAALLLLGQGQYRFGPGFKASHVPAGAVNFVRRERITGRVFNSYPFGGYLAWEGIPTFIDGRGGLVYSGDLIASYQRGIDTEEGWAELERKWGFTTAIFEYDVRSMGRHFPRHLADDAEWALVYWDDHSAVYLKRTVENQRVIERGAYQLLKPSFNDFSYLDGVEERIPLPRLMEMAEHDVGLNLANQEPRLARVFLADGLGADPEALIREVRQCLQLEPNLAMEHSALAYLYLKAGREAEAVPEIRSALELNPIDPVALDLKRKVRP